MTSNIEESVLAGALEYWRGVNLASLLRELDEAGLAIVDNQKTSLQERRRLAEKTKAFRAVSEEEKPNEFKPLLRAYQNEIDALTKRMKFAETSFLQLFKSLSEAPDPEPFLAGLVEERRLGESRAKAQADVARAEARVEGLVAEAAELRERARGAEALQRQLDSLQAGVDAAVREQTAQREKEIKEQSEDLVKHLKDRESDLQRQLSAANRRLALVQSTHESQEAERAELSVSADRELIGKLAELDIVQSDLDHSNARLVEVQAQNAKLRAELSMLTGDSSSSATGGVAETLAEYRRRLRELDEETARLFASLEKSEAELSHQQARYSAALGSAEREAHAKDEQLHQLRAELKRCADYDEIKRDLDVMKSVEFSAWGQDNNNLSDDEDDDGDESLEKLLVRRNKALENRLTDTKNQLAERQADLSAVREQCQALETTLAQKTVLAERLEADLLQVQPAAASKHSISNDEGGSSDAIEMNLLGGSSAAVANTGLLEIVTGQRDRFRQRNIELDDELRAQGASSSELRRQVEQVKQDNLRLYEEIKYLRSYTSTMSSNDSTAIAIPSGGRQVDMDTGVGAKYKGMYEESLNPFNAFHRRETSRRVRSMSILDRLIYMFSNFVMGNRRARMVMLLYVGLLHLLVVATLYRSMLQADDSSHERAPVPPGGP
ncbi:hypothetical protein GGH92_002534 [Coemansia sp. RSA 2673]|nr:hypothetical protein GGH92_002534 [Coemansia sp. RSA 2673]